MPRSTIAYHFLFVRPHSWGRKVEQYGIVNNFRGRYGRVTESDVDLQIDRCFLKICQQRNAKTTVFLVVLHRCHRQRVAVEDQAIFVLR